METGSKTRKGDREIVSVSIPVPVYDALMTLCDHYNCNRSAVVTSAIVQYLDDMGIKVREP